MGVGQSHPLDDHDPGLEDGSGEGEHAVKVTWGVQTLQRIKGRAVGGATAPLQLPSCSQSCKVKITSAQEAQR